MVPVIELAVTVENAGISAGGCWFPYSSLSCVISSGVPILSHSSQVLTLMSIALLQPTKYAVRIRLLTIIDLAAFVYLPKVQCLNQRFKKEVFFLIH